MTSARPAAVAIGFFDGVHLGHRRILRALRDAASAAGARPAVLTFSNHPLAVVDPKSAPPLLMPRARRIAELAAAAGCEVAALDFTPALAAMAPEDFIARLHAMFGRVSCVFCGPGWRFGAQGRGNAATLAAAGIDVRETPFAMSGGERISSTRIRAAVRSGDLAAAAAMLGRPFALCGAVRPGKGEGRKLGFPTVNIVPAAGMCLPPRGAYAIEGGVANFGTAPTFGEDAWSEPVLEAHYFARPPDFPDGGAEVPLLRFLRPERRFADVASLRAQIAMDIAAAKSAGNGCGTGPDLHG